MSVSHVQHARTLNGLNFASARSCSLGRARTNARAVVRNDVPDLDHARRRRSRHVVRNAPRATSSNNRRSPRGSCSGSPKDLDEDLQRISKRILMRISKRIQEDLLEDLLVDREYVLVEQADLLAAIVLADQEDLQEDLREDLLAGIALLDREDLQEELLEDLGSSLDPLQSRSCSKCGLALTASSSPSSVALSVYSSALSVSSFA